MCQNYLTKFMVLIIIKIKTAEKVAYQVADIFISFGASSVLQSNNGREFFICIVNCQKEMWFSLKIGHGKPQPPIIWCI